MRKIFNDYAAAAVVATSGVHVLGPGRGAHDDLPPPRITRARRITRYKYCRHSCGTTGLVAGGVTGAVVGSKVLGGGILGAAAGAVGGAVAGRAIDRCMTAKDRCRCYAGSGKAGS